MKTKRIKFVLVSCTLLLCLALLGFGVYSVSKPELSITGQISYQASGVSVLVQGRVRDAKIKSTGERLYKQYPDSTATLEGYNSNAKILDSAGQYLNYTDEGENQTLSDWNFGALQFYEDSTGVKPTCISLKITNFSDFPIKVEITPNQSQLDNVLRLTNKTTAILDGNTSEYNWDEILIYYTIDDEEKSVSDLDMGFVVKMSRYFAPESTVLKNESGQDVLTYTKVKETTTSTSEYATFSEATTDATGIRITSYNLANDPNKYTKDGTDTADVVIPETIEGLPVVEIGESAFANIAISSITMPNCIKSILGSAFSYCSLNQIKIPNGTEYLGENSFAGWTKLDFVDLGTNLKYVDSHTLRPADIDKKLDSAVVFPSSVKILYSSIVCDAENFFAINIVLSSNLKQIDADEENDVCRSFCSSGTNKILVDPDNSEYISYNNNLLVELSTKTLVSGTGSTKDIPYDLNVTSIGCFAFQHNTGLTSVRIPETVISIEYSAFSNCTGLKSIIIPISVTDIEHRTFSDCANLIAVTIPNSVTSIGEGAFSGCKSLVSISIPNSVTSIEDYAISDCTALKNENNLYNNAYYIGNSSNPHLVLISAKSKDVTECEINSNTKFICNEAFFGCTSLTSVTIPNGVKCIQSNVFDGCTGLESIMIPNSVTDIGFQAFQSCTGLTSITIPKSVTNMEGGTFNYCTGLTSVTVYATTPPKGSYMFNNCSKLTKIYVPAASVDAYKAANGWKTYASKIVAIA